MTAEPGEAGCHLAQSTQNALVGHPPALGEMVPISSRQSCLLIPGPRPTGCVTLSKLLDLSETEMSPKSTVAVYREETI